MDETTFVSSLEDLTGKIAVVTGGTQGIGLQTTLYLSRLGATVYVCALDTPKDLATLDAAIDSLLINSAKGSPGSIKFHPLDLSSIESTKASAEHLREKLDVDGGGEGKGRIDILVCNAGIMFSPQSELTIDGYEKTWGVNCLGHFGFATSLLDIVERTGKITSDARIVITSSEGYKLATKLDYDALKTVIPDDGRSIQHLKRSFQRYCNSKLGALYLALELSMRLKDRGVVGVRVNAAHPGRAARTEIGDYQQTFMSPWMSKLAKRILTLGYVMSHTVADSAKTQVFLAASRKIREDDVRGEYWVPTFNWILRYTGSEKEEITELGCNREESAKMWKFCEEAVK